MNENGNTTITEEEIKCIIFQSEKGGIRQLTSWINTVHDIEQKRRDAEELFRIVSRLLTCSCYLKESEECQSCRIINNSRLKMAESVLKVEAG